MEVVVAVLVAGLAAVVAVTALVVRRRRRRARQAAPAPAPGSLTTPASGSAPAEGAPSLWPEPEPRAQVHDAPPAQDQVQDQVPARRSEGWRGRVPFAEPLSARLEPGAPDTPAELVARFDAIASAEATDEVVATLTDLGYEVRWRRPAELALGSGDGHVARILVESRPEGGATVGVELEPDEVADVAVGLLDRLRAAGYRVDRRGATTVVLRDDAGGVVAVTRVPTLRA